MKKNFLAVIVLIVCVHVVITARGESRIESNYFPAAEWRVSTPEEQGIDSGALAKMVTEIVEKKIGVHSLLIIRNGFMVLDAYFYPFTPNTKHDLASCSKSILSLLIGIAIDKGFLKSIDEKALSFFPQVPIENLTKEKKLITIKDLLTMRSGLLCDNSHGEVTLQQLLNSRDWLKFVLDLPMQYSPGTHWAYNSPGVYLLSAILSNASNLSALNFAQKYLFYPLGIYDVAWTYDPQSRYNLGWGDLRMTPYDMAKIGYLMLNMGNWHGRQVISSKWVTLATRPQVTDGVYEKEKYGYLWWVSKRDKGVFYAKGRGGQFIVVWPSKNLVVVSTGEASSESDIGGYLRSRVVDSIKSDKSLPMNKEGYRALNRAVKRALQEKPKMIPFSSSLPKMAKIISGRLFAIPGIAGAQFSLTFIEPDRVILKEILPNGAGDTFYFNIRNVSQRYLGKYCIPGSISGYWASDKTFIFNQDEIGNNHNYHIEVTFENGGSKALVKIRERTENT